MLSSGHTELSSDGGGCWEQMHRFWQLWDESCASFPRRNYHCKGEGTRGEWMGRVGCPGVSRLAWLAWEKPRPSKCQFMSLLMPGQKVTGSKLRERLLCLPTVSWLKPYFPHIWVVISMKCKSHANWCKWLVCTASSKVSHFPFLWGIWALLMFTWESWTNPLVTRAHSWSKQHGESGENQLAPGFTPQMTPS